MTTEPPIAAQPCEDCGHVNCICDDLEDEEYQRQC